MMIRYIKGDLFKSPAQTLVNTVNTVGVMGKGIALEFKKRYPEMFASYRKECEKHNLVMGRLMLCGEADHRILLFPTKENWRNPSSLRYIEDGLIRFCQIYAEKGISSVAFPKLGCGNGELDWDDVRPLMERYLAPLPIDVFIYLDSRAVVPEHKDQEGTAQWMKSNARDLSFNGIEDELRYNYSMIPFVFESSGSSWSVSWDDGLVFSSGAGGSKVGSDTFFDYWEMIRTNGVVRRDADPDRTLVLDMLLEMGYLSSVMIIDADGSSHPGYQVNEGAGRVFSLNGGSYELS